MEASLCFRGGAFSIPGQYIMKISIDVSKCNMDRSHGQEPLMNLSNLGRTVDAADGRKRQRYRSQYGSGSDRWPGRIASCTSLPKCKEVGPMSRTGPQITRTCRPTAYLQTFRDFLQFCWISGILEKKANPGVPIEAWGRRPASFGVLGRFFLMANSARVTARKQGLLRWAGVDRVAFLHVLLIGPIFVSLCT